MSLQSKVLMAPSLLSADFAHLADACALMEEAGADFLHCDVMDGHFVPNLTFGPPVIAALKKVTSIPLDVHLMINNPDETVDWYIEAGADMVVVHAESCEHLHRVIAHVKSRGVQAGVSLNPASPLVLIEEVLDVVDMVLLMSVNPGFGGQSFIPSVTDKVRRLAVMCEERGVSPLIQVDGGINPDTAAEVCAAGANCLVAGNAVFGASNPITALKAIRTSGESARTR